MQICAVTKSFAALVIASVFIGTLAVAAGPPVPPTEKQPVKDSWVTAKVKIALFADDRVHGRDVNVETKQGTVYLRGKVDYPEAKAAADEIAKTTEGAIAVKNELQVVAPEKKKAVKANDEAITKQVKRHFARDQDVKHASIDVKTNAGVVSLSGEADDFATAAKASYIAWKVPGVKSVKNDLTVKEKV